MSDFKEEVEESKYESNEVGTPLSLNDTESDIIDVEDEVEEKREVNKSFVKKDVHLDEDEVEEKKGKVSKGIYGGIKYLMFFVIFVIVIFGISFIYDIYSDMTKENPLSSSGVSNTAYTKEINIPSVSTTLENKNEVSLAEKYRVSDTPSVVKKKIPVTIEGQKTTEHVLLEKKQQEAPANSYGVPSLPEEESSFYATSFKKDPISKGKSDILLDVESGIKENKLPLGGVETEMMGIDETNYDKIRNGGTCELSTKYKANDEYVYYISTNSGFTPVFKNNNWDGKGIVIPAKIVAESYNSLENFIEVEKGKFLPAEMFSKCEAI